MMKYICVSVASIMLATIPTAGSARTIRMISATYGNLGAGRVCDATAAFASSCNGRSQCDVRVGNDSLCGDPDFLVVKKVRVSYRCGGSTQKMIVDEYENASLLCR